jgi:hypothetical protein
MSLVLLCFFNIRNFVTFLTAFNFRSFLLNLGILILYTQTGPFVCLLQIVFVSIFKHLGNLLICWVIRIGECKDFFYEQNQTSNLKIFVHPYLKMFLVDFSSFPVDRRVKDLCQNFYCRTLERIEIELEVNSDLYSL